MFSLQAINTFSHFSAIDELSLIVSTADSIYQALPCHAESIFHKRENIWHHFERISSHPGVLRSWRKTGGHRRPGGSMESCGRRIITNVRNGRKLKLDSKKNKRFFYFCSNFARKEVFLSNFKHNLLETAGVGIQQSTFCYQNIYWTEDSGWNNFSGPDSTTTMVQYLFLYECFSFGI